MGYIVNIKGGGGGGGGEALISEITQGKEDIAAAINAKGGTADPLESFQQLADDIVNLNSSFITYGVEVTEKMHWLRFICDSSTVARLPLTAIDDDIITTISQHSAFQGCEALESVKMTALTTISGGSAFQSCSSLQILDLPNLTATSGSAFRNCTALQTLDLPNLTTIADYSFGSCSSLQTLDLPNLASIGNYAFQFCTALQDVIAPDLTSIATSPFENCAALRNVVFGTVTSLAEPFKNAKPNLRNITIGQDININLPFQNWTATAVIGEQSGIDELNSNLQTNLISKLYQGGGKILRLGVALYDVTTQETRDMVTAKGWILQRG